MTGPVLQVDDLHLSFAGIRALRAVSFEVAAGELFAIIGPNGAGKTSLFNCLSGLYRPQQGAIRFAGRDLVGVKPDRIARAGMARTFQNIELFEHLTVLDNLLLGRHLHVDYGVGSALLWLGRARREEVRHRRVVEDIEAEGRPAARVGLKVRFRPFTTLSRSLTLPEPTNDVDTVLSVASDLLREFDPPRPVRLIGVRVAGLDEPHDERGPRSPGQMELAL